MAYKRISPMPVVEGGTGAQTLTGVLIGNGTSAVTGNAVTQYDVLVGGASNAISSVAPSATSGVPLISGGSSANPSFGTAVVAGGGTGVATMTTAYAPVCAGTTATGALQVASTGLSTSGYVLTSNGASALPSFQAVSGGISTIDGNSGSVTGSTITITGGTSGAVFTGSSATLTESFNYLALPATTSTNGQITIGGSPVLHSYGVGLYSYNTFAGSGAGGGFASTGSQNCAIGANALYNLTSGNSNTALGTVAMYNETTGSYNVAVGNSALDSSNGSEYNTAVGFQAGYYLGTGQYNSLMGYSAGSSYESSESSNICINSTGSTGESHVCRIGSGTGTGTEQLNKTFISGIQGITVTGTPVLVSSSDQLGIAASSIRFKENVVDMADASSDIMKLRPVMFNYKGDPANVNPGLIAEEVNEVMPSLVVYEKDGQPLTVKYHDLPSLLLNELQKAVKRIEVLEAKLLNQN